jgi:hypothetical protein
VPNIQELHILSSYCEHRQHGKCRGKARLARGLPDTWCDCPCHRRGGASSKRRRQREGVKGSEAAALRAETLDTLNRWAAKHAHKPPSPA